jgi:hypothetical protein
MKLLKLIEQIDKADPEFQDRISPRRDAIKNITSFGSKVAVAALPFAFGTLFKKAYGQTNTTTVNNILNYLLKLEYLENAFINFSTVAGQPGSAPAAPPAGLSAFTTSEISQLSFIQKNDIAHVAFLKFLLGSNAIANTTQGNPTANGIYDYTYGGVFPTVMTNVNTWLTVAQIIKDTVTRAYIGQALPLVGTTNLNITQTENNLQELFNLKSAEARHASVIRQMIYARGTTTVKPWISGANDTGNANAGITTIYAGESNVVQEGITLTSLTGASGAVTATAASEAFDEPITMANVLTYLAPFGVR